MTARPTSIGLYRGAPVEHAARSMAAVGMLAPFIESLFKQAFPGIRNQLDRNGRAPIAHARWTMPKDKQWGCRRASPDRLHLGFEWPDAERSAFERRIVTDDWPQGCFSQATSDRKPWIFYLSDTFVQHCLATVDHIFAGLGAFVRRND